MNQSVIESVNGANVVLNDEVLASEVWEPMFFWYWQLLNVAITFVPVIVVVSCFWLIYWYLKGLWNKKSRLKELNDLEQKINKEIEILERNQEEQETQIEEIEEKYISDIRNSNEILKNKYISFIELD